MKQLAIGFLMTMLFSIGCGSSPTVEGSVTLTTDTDVFETRIEPRVELNAGSYSGTCSVGGDIDRAELYADGESIDEVVITRGAGRTVELRARFRDWRGECSGGASTNSSGRFDIDYRGCVMTSGDDVASLDLSLEFLDCNVE